ncbi:hypothetical protein PVAND_014893 [Polypedilum vanderplanki]|uniref:Inositol-1-monophosphatase n=1 Tax=Polypedilum vanderplanki TaxID=319348 RepID=A0A9J6BBB9_POLVA|nr:hypothetical protein PVAND_014893 [Polypedilum vanderplanki]
MNSEELKECFEYVKDLILKCGEILKEGFKDCGEVMTKANPSDVVTIYDQKIEEILIGGIRKKYPDHKFIAEEQAAKSKEAQVLTSLPTWIIDPIDGSLNFVAKSPLVCISVALTINEDLVIAFLYNPLTNEFFSAQKGLGAFLNGNKIKVRETEVLQGSTIATEINFGTFPFVRPQMMAKLNLFFENHIRIRTLGSAALEMGYLAKGTFQLFLCERLKPWDVAAGALIILEAGGVVIDIKTGEDYKIMQPNIIAASNMKIALELKKALDGIDAKLEEEGKTPKILYEKFIAAGGNIKDLR